MVMHMWDGASTRAADITDFPLEPPDTSSPRATMESFLSNMQETHWGYTKVMQQYQEEPGWYPSPAVEAEVDRVRIFFKRARRCLDMSEVPPTLVDRVEREATVLLKAIFDRISLPPLESIPDAKEMNTHGLLRWQIPNTEITIAQVQKGPRAGEYLFSPTTVDRLDEDYEHVKHLPFKPGGWVGVYVLYTELTGEIIPAKLISILPNWTKARYLDHPLWKWILAALLLVVAIMVLAMVYRLSYGGSQDQSLHRSLRRLLFPTSIMLMAYLLDYLQKDIGFRGHITEGMSTILLAVTFLAAGWTILQIGSLIAEGVIAGPHTTATGMDAAMIRVVSRIISFAIATWIIIIGAQTIGIPLVPVLAGLGVGGLALALSAQPTIENFIGGMTLFADRPVRLGEMVKFGKQFGTVEEIGVRSTRIRTLDRTLVNVPNAEFSKLHLENFTKRDKLWFHPRIHLRLDTTPDQLRYILVETRKILYAHPKVLRDPARVRFVEFGTYSLDLDIFAYIDVTDFGEFLEIAEDLNLRIMEVVARAGSSLAIPATQKYVEKGKGPDEKQVRDVEAEVRAWRETNALYLPKFPEEKIEELKDTLEYPPPGSPAQESKKKD